MMQLLSRVQLKIKGLWIQAWMIFSRVNAFRKIATRIAASATAPYYGRHALAHMNPKGYISPKAEIFGESLRLGANIFLDDRVLIYQGWESGPVVLEDGVHIYRDTIIQTGSSGSITIGAGSHIQPRCQFSAYKSSIKIGKGVQIAPNCSFFPYQHGFDAGEPISQQPLKSKGEICIEDDAWLGTGVIVLDGVRIGRGAVVGAGAVVSKNLPDDSISIGNPARVIKMRSKK